MSCSRSMRRKYQRLPSLTTASSPLTARFRKLVYGTPRNSAADWAESIFDVDGDFTPLLHAEHRDVQASRGVASGSPSPVPRLRALRSSAPSPSRDAEHEW